MLFVGILIGVLLVVFINGAVAASKMTMIDNVVYKDIVGAGRSGCAHELINPERINGIELIECRYCSGVFAKLSDLRRTQYE